MKKILSTIALVAMVSVSAQAAMTSDKAVNEVEGSSTASYVLGSNVQNTFGLSFGYSRLLMDWLQGSVFGGFSTTTVAAPNVSNIVIWTALVGPTFDYAMDNTGTHNAVFLRALGGIAYGSAGGVSSTNFGYRVDLGKRFGFYPGWSWNPAIGMSGVAATGASPVFNITPASFSFEF